MQDLTWQANQINNKLTLANSIAQEISLRASGGSIVSDGTVATAHITDVMVENYNAAYQAVLDAEYFKAKDVFEDEAATALDNMSLAIDDLVEATAVLAEVSAVAEIASTAETTDEKLQAQAALETTDMTIAQADVDNFNNSLDAVEDYAQQAGAFLSAANNTNITETIDNFAAANNMAVASYTAVSYAQDIDKLLLEFDASSTWISFHNYFENETLTPMDVWSSVGHNPYLR